MFRVGIGHDTHRLGPGRPLILGGLKIEHPRGLIGHSDADVVLHALTDALSAPPAWAISATRIPTPIRNIRTAIRACFVIETLKRLQRKRLAHRQRRSDDLRPGAEAGADQGDRCANIWPRCWVLPVDAVNVKAKTGEKVGAIGRAEAIGCQVIVLIENT